MTRLLQILAVALLTTAAPAMAASFAINNTGGATPGSIEPNWLVDGNTTFVTAVAYPFPIWLANSGTSSWISPQASYAAGQADSIGTHTYSTTFDLSGLDETTASLSFIVIADDALTDVLINGTSTGLTYNGGLGAFSGVLSVNAGFISGVNTIEFETLNAGTLNSPNGLRVEFTSATARDPSEVPEPSSIALFGLGILLFSSRRLSRKN